MTQVYLDIGSNIDRRKNIQSCIDQLLLDFPKMRYSKAYESEAYGFEGDPFINLSASFQTDLSYQELKAYLKQLEDRHARKRIKEKYIARTLDADILLFGNLILQPDIDLPRAEILQYPFVLFPLVELAADFVHPIEKKTIAKIVKESKLNKDSLKEIKNFPITHEK